MTTLAKILSTEDLRRVQSKFHFDVGSVICEWGPTDGPFNRMASARSDGLFKSTGKIIFDPTDWPREGADLSNYYIRETLFHELFHLEQFRRGIVYRCKMKYWNNTLDYGIPPNLNRPHEIEAYKKGHEYATNWR